VTVRIRPRAVRSCHRGALDSSRASAWIAPGPCTGSSRLVQTETPMITPDTSAVSESLLVVPSLPKGSQSDKHLYGTNSSAARLA
jgi:hypothetical protein